MKAFDLKRAWLFVALLLKIRDTVYVLKLFNCLAGAAITVLIYLLALVFGILALTGSPVWSGLWILLSVWFVGGLILITLGVVGEYVGKAYLETKRRPRYIISQILNR